jgi:hypothetical protein
MTKVVCFGDDITGTKLQQRKSVLSPGLDGFCSSGIKYDKRTAPRPKFCFGGGDYRNKGHNPKKLSSVPVLVKMSSVPWKLMTAKR